MVVVVRVSDDAICMMIVPSMLSACWWISRTPGSSVSVFSDPPSWRTMQSMHSRTLKPITAGCLALTMGYNAETRPPRPSDPDSPQRSSFWRRLVFRIDPSPASVVQLSVAIRSMHPLCLAHVSPAQTPYLPGALTIRLRTSWTNSVGGTDAQDG